MPTPVDGGALGMCSIMAPFFSSSGAKHLSHLVAVQGNQQEAYSELWVLFWIVKMVFLLLAIKQTPSKKVYQLQNDGPNCGFNIFDAYLCELERETTRNPPISNRLG